MKNNATATRSDGRVVALEQAVDRLMERAYRLDVQLRRMTWPAISAGLTACAALIVAVAR